MDPRSRALLELQRESLARSLWDNPPEPRVGDVWLTRVSWPTGIAEGLAAMIVVLRAFTEAWSARPLYDVAPLSDDERLASEWSLLLDASVSGLGFPIVAHVEAQSTTNASMLTRRLGALARLALADLDLLLDAYAIGDTTPLQLSVGRTGRSGIRHHLEWEEFASALLAISQALSSHLLENTDGAPNDEVERGDQQHIALVRETKPPGYGNRWTFESDPPRLVDLASERDSIVRLGHVFAFYLQDAPVRSFDRSAFERLRVLLDVEYNAVAGLNNAQRVTYLLKLLGPVEGRSGDLGFVATSLLHWRVRCASEGLGISLDRLAARKADPRRT